MKIRPLSVAGGAGTGALLFLSAIALSSIPAAAWTRGGASLEKPGQPSPIQDGPSQTAPSQTASRDTAVFAGGCFWCMEPPFDKLDGVISTTSGYAGGSVPNPSYEAVTAGGTGHRESVQVVFDPGRVKYQALLEAFWKNVDPLDEEGQFCDRGLSYTTAIFAQDEGQARLAEESKLEIQKGFEKPLVTPIVQGAAFYPAEDYHQDYYLTNSIRYRFYRWSCGRDARLEELWGSGH
jgi:peptide-methionine (S)-S-oxide reductase